MAKIKHIIKKQHNRVFYEGSYYGVIYMDNTGFHSVAESLCCDIGVDVKYLCANEDEIEYLKTLGVTEVDRRFDWFKVVRDE